MSDSHISFENKDYYIELGLNIAFYRKRAGMTQDMLAEKANLSRSAQPHPPLLPGDTLQHRPGFGRGTLPPFTVQGMTMHLYRKTPPKQICGGRMPPIR